MRLWTSHLFHIVKKENVFFKYDYIFQNHDDIFLSSSHTQRIKKHLSGMRYNLHNLFSHSVSLR